MPKRQPERRQVEPPPRRAYPNPNDNGEIASADKRTEAGGPDQQERERLGRNAGKVFFPAFLWVMGQEAMQQWRKEQHQQQSALRGIGKMVGQMRCDEGPQPALQTTPNMVGAMTFSVVSRHVALSGVEQRAVPGWVASSETVASMGRPIITVFMSCGCFRRTKVPMMN